MERSETPEPVILAEKYNVVGQGVSRVDDWKKVTGKKVYGFDEWRPDMLHGKVFRSEHPHARIVSLDTSRAEKLPGVVAVITGEDIPYTHGLYVKDEPFLARDKVRYIGEPVAAVAAESPEIAEEAVDLITAEYEPLPAVFDPCEAMEPDAPLIHERLGAYEHDQRLTVVPGTNICNHYKLRRGDVDVAFANADYMFENEFTTQMQAHCCIEPHMAIAEIDPTGRIVLWTNTQGPYRFRKQLARALGLSQQKLRVVITGVGGAFGGKMYPRILPIAIALAMYTEHRPVRLALSREEEFSATTVRQPSVTKLKTGVTKDGFLIARQVTVIFSTGAYADCGPLVTRQAGMTAAGPYKIPNVRIDGYCVYTNEPVGGGMRGYGTPQVAWAYESQMDIIAARLRIDPLALRLKNGFNEGDLSATGEKLQSVGLKNTLRKAAEAVQWNERAQSADSSRHRGKGLACMHKVTSSPTASLATIMLNGDGDVNLLISSVEMGQGSNTVLSQMIAEELGVSLDRIHIASPDTDCTPYDTSTTGSRTTFHMGNAILDAIRDAKDQLLPRAAVIMQADVSELEWRRGEVHFKEEAGSGLSFDEIIRHHYGSAGADVVGRGSFSPAAEPLDKETGQSKKPSAFWMYGTQAAEVEVDVETGEVEVLRIVAVHDVGKAINPVAVKQQIEGGVIQGVGAALYEQVFLDQGRVLNDNFESYRIPTALDVPPIRAIIVEEPHPEGPCGAKGVGEPVQTPTGAAIANAVYDAVGVRIRNQPITAEKVLQALKAREPENVYF